MQPHRRPWLAGLLSILSPGLGHLYNGDLSLTGAVFGAQVGIYLLSSFFVVREPRLIWVDFFSIAGLRIANCVWAVVRAKRSKPGPAKRFQKLGYYLLYFACVICVFWPIYRLAPYRSYKIPSQSMEPTLALGDNIYVDHWAYLKAQPERGDLIVFEHPKIASTTYAKRLIGLPGDKVEIRKKRLWINGVQVPVAKAERGLSPSEPKLQPESFAETLGSHTYTIWLDPLIEEGVGFGPYTVPPGEYLVLGDNRDYSNDSRFWGMVPAANVLGKVKYIYLSLDEKNSKFRWGRVSKTVE